MKIKYYTSKIEKYLTQYFQKLHKPTLTDSLMHQCLFSTACEYQTCLGKNTIVQKKFGI